MRKLNDIVLCVDFDGTINNADAPFPNPGTPRVDAIKYLNKLYNEGYYILVWSCRSGMHQLIGEKWLLDHGISFDKFNESRPHEKIQFDGHDTRKVWGTVYIDDRNLEWKIKGIPSWEEIYNMCQQLKPENCVPNHDK